MCDGSVNRVVVDPADAGHVVAVGEHLTKVRRDGGKTFRDAAGAPDPTFSDVLFAPDDVRSLAQPPDGRLLFAGTATGGVFRRALR